MYVLYVSTERFLRLVPFLEGLPAFLELASGLASAPQAHKVVLSVQTPAV